MLDKFQGDVGRQLWIAGFRMIPAAITPFLLFLHLNRRKNLTAPFKDRTVWAPLVGSSVFATYLGISFWIIGMGLTQASTASILNQTATIFILICARIFLKEPLTKRRVLAILIAMSGVYLMFVG